MKVSGNWLTRSPTQAVFSLLADAGHQVFAVGGCVRNALLGVPVADVDLATDARPETVLELAAAKKLRAVPTGIDHGTVTVVVDGLGFEVTTFRRDVETDGRRAVVAYADDIETDAHRRDFTVNALYSDRDGQVHDPLGGLSDLEARQIRFIDDAGERIREDALRILRFFRFHALYGDDDAGLDQDGLAAAAEHVELLDDLSKERVGSEMRRLLAAPDPAPALAAFAATGGLARILPGANAGGLAPLVAVENNTPPRALRRLAVIGGEDVATRLRLSRSETRDLAGLKRALGDDSRIEVLAYRFGAEIARDATLIRASSIGLAPPPDLEASLARGATATLPVRARDLIDDVGEGPELGALMKDLETYWIASNFAPTREDLLARAKAR